MADISCSCSYFNVLLDFNTYKKSLYTINTKMRHCSFNSLIKYNFFLLKKILLDQRSYWVFVKYHLLRFNRTYSMIILDPVLSLQSFS